MFEAELTYFIEHQDELVAKYPGKYLVIRGSELIDACDTPLEAYTVGAARFEPGTFMIQQAVSGPSAYTVTIASLGVVKACA